MTFSKNWIALQREGMLAGQSIGEGLTNFRKGYKSRGIFYSGMFLTTIGLERMMKLILILDYQINKNRYPTEKELKKYSHSLKVLYQTIKEIETNNHLQIKYKVNDT